METAKLFKALGTSDEYTACQLCGRDDLKSTIALQQLDADGNAVGEVVYYGSDCGARATGWTQTDVRKAAKDADEATRRADMVRRAAESAAAFKVWESFVLGATGADDLATGIRQLGGFTAARTAFEAA